MRGCFAGSPGAGIAPVAGDLPSVEALLKIEEFLVELGLADLKGVVDGIEADYANAKEVAKVMAERERDPEVRLH